MTPTIPVTATPAGLTGAELLARTLFAEAGTRPVRAIEALAALILNRARAHLPPRPPRVPGTAPFAPGGHARLPEVTAREVAAACRTPFLFPSRNPRHPAHLRLVAPPETDLAMAICRRIATRALAGVLPDPTGGATHWHGEEALPSWAVAHYPTAECGGLVFYRPDPAAPPARGATPTLVAAA
ncbi:cell wall hydrolase [Muricoccus radiodurans]|uniref:cell wall hydrolase n=1 Tax=Muricoccus radiodurans TaxID=2231721 RepID=UPI003CF81E98